MNIGIDIDGTITDMQPFMFKYCTLYAKAHDLIFDKSDCSFSHIQNATRQEISINEHWDNFWNENVWKYADEIIIRQNVKEVLQEFKSMGHNIYIITARKFACEEDFNLEMYQKVVSLFEENDLPYDKIVITKNKIGAIKKYNIDIMIEDLPSNIEIISQSIPTICMECNYNLDCKGENIINCKDWKEILSKIKSMS